MLLRMRGIGFLPIYSSLIFFNSFQPAADTDPDMCTYFSPQTLSLSRYGIKILSYLLLS